MAAKKATKRARPRSKKAASPKRAKEKKNPSQRVVRAKMMGAIRRTARQAAKLRLEGKVAQAQHFDREVDKLARTAGRHGWGDEAVLAGERGRQAAGRKRPRASNPRRPPGAWWRRCIARTSRRDMVRSPEAVCGAAWWRKPEADRRRVVEELERSGTTRGRRQAFALALAEEHHRHGRPGHAKKKTRLAA